jgi:WD40 repeat protein
MRTLSRTAREALAALMLLVAPPLLGAGPVSYHREVAPLLQRHCYGCHHPGKLKGDVDLTSVALMQKGGKHGAAVVPGAPATSVLISEVSGPDPAMPKDGERLSGAQVELLERWIREGARDDSPPAPPPRTEPPDYLAPPVLGAMDFSLDGRRFAVGGYHEILIFDAGSLARTARWIGAPARIDAVRFSPDSRRLAVVGGDPGVRGEVQVWDVESGRPLVRVAPADDSLFGVDWSPDGLRLSCGGADRTVRVFQASDGRELLRAAAHSDWVLGAVFVKGGEHLVSGGRDRSLRLLEAGTGKLLDVLNRETEPVVRLARQPGQERVAFAGGESRVRIYKAEAKPPSTDLGRDHNFVREFDSYGDGTTAVAFSSDGTLLAFAGVPSDEVRVQDAASGKRVTTLRGHAGAVFGLAFSADSKRLVTAGFEGRLRVFEIPSGKALSNFCPVEITAAAKLKR